ncbi:hypothetical protein ACI65C_003706 [Semiaphis heraclei]
MNMCRLFGFGLQHNGVAAAAVDALIVLANLSYSAYAYNYVMSIVQQRMPFKLEITTFMNVVKLQTYLLTPPVMLIMWQYHKRSLSDALRDLSNAMIETAAAMSLAPFAWYSIAWLCMSLVIEYFIYTLFHIDTDFVYFTVTDYVMMTVYNVWFKVPLLMYVFLMDTIRMSARDINSRLTTVSEWRTYRGRWDDLRQMAVHMARHQFGVTIVAFMVYSIAEIVFSVFMVYLYSYSQKNTLKIIIYSIKAFFSTAWMFEIIRMSKNCKLEVQDIYNTLLKTQKVLNSIIINFNSDYKQIKYASLHTLHADFSFMPCNIFEMNYRNCNINHRISDLSNSDEPNLKIPDVIQLY